MRPCFLSEISEVASTRIKICGITSPEDALMAVDCGADAIGLVFYPPSPRAVSTGLAAQIAAVVPPFVSIVALCVDEPAEGVNRITSEVEVDILQFHGEESGDFCRQFGRPWVKALRVRDGADVAGACAGFNGARGVLLDTWQEGTPGGTGKTFDWQLAVRDLPLPVILAGGLHAANVGEAIATVRPAAVDVSGGVERSPGVKDELKIRQFIKAVRAADKTLDGNVND